MHALLERVSLIFQRDDLSIGDVGAEVNTASEENAANWRAKCTTL